MDRFTIDKSRSRQKIIAHLDNFVSRPVIRPGVRSDDLMDHLVLDKNYLGKKKAL